MRRDLQNDIDNYNNTFVVFQLCFHLLLYNDCAFTHLVKIPSYKHLHTLCHHLNDYSSNYTVRKNYKSSRKYCPRSHILALNHAPFVITKKIDPSLVKSNTQRTQFSQFLVFGDFYARKIIKKSAYGS